MSLSLLAYFGLLKHCAALSYFPDSFLEGVQLQSQGKYKEAMASYKAAFDANDEHVGGNAM